MHPSNRRETVEAWTVLVSNVKAQGLVWWKGEGEETPSDVAGWEDMVWCACSALSAFSCCQFYRSA